MANSLKELMGLTAAELIGMGAQYGLSFSAGMKKRDMAQQLVSSLASGWMDVNKQLLTGIPEDEGETLHYGDANMLSDAAHVAQMLSSAGFTETFNSAMAQGHTGMLDSYLKQLGVATEDVYLHMPHSNPNETPRSNLGMKAFIEKRLTGHQDAMQELPGHYAGDIAKEFATPQGHIMNSYEHLAHMYLDISRYNNESEYTKDVQNVSIRLASQMGSGFAEVAASSAMGAHVSYMDILPQVGDESLVGGTRHPRYAMNAAGLPLGSEGSAVGNNGGYSFTASVTGTPGWSDESKAIYGEAAGTLRKMAEVYRGGSDTGLNTRTYETSDRDMILDSASRYKDIFDVRHGYANLVKESGGAPQYSRESIAAVLDNAVDYNTDDQTFEPSKRSNFDESGALAGARRSSSTAFEANFEEPLSWNSARSRRESKAISDYDSIPFRDVADYGTGKSRQESSVRYHDELQQGSDEWLAFRENYDITGSTVGSYLGNNAFTRPWKEMTNKLGLNHSGGASSFQQRMFAEGHKTEDEARVRVADELGIKIQQTGAITNDQYPAFMYSPDGLIGDDALWEHKNPERAGKFADLNKGDHPDYMDQVQLGMLVSGRSRTLFSQTIGDRTESQWVDQDPSWYDRNRNKIDSTLGRLDAGRAFIRDNADLPPEELTKGARAAMQGEGIWKDIRQRSNRGYDEDAGTEQDPFLRSRSSFAEQPSSYSNYIPNFTMPEQGGGSSPAASGPNTQMAEAVKIGILSAQEENRQRGSGNADMGGGGGGRGGSSPMYDADFGPNQEEVSRWFGGGGGGGKPPRGYNIYEDMGDSMGALARGAAGGTIGSLKGGAMTALMSSPIGTGAAIAIGSASIAAEAIEGMNDYYGEGLDAGLTNPIEYSSMSQGLETLGLSESQASSVNQTTHSAYNTMLNGDPSGTIRIVRGTRGLITGGDIRSTQGDPVALARIVQDKGRARGWSQARIAGAMQMAGLSGMARAYDRGDYASDLASETVDSGRGADYGGVSSVESAQAERAQLRPTYLAPRFGIEHGGDTLDAASSAMFNARHGAQTVSRAAGDAVDAVEEGWHDFIAQAESGGNELARNLTSSAKGAMQVLDATARNPGFGVRPAQNNSPEERSRVGRDYADALRRHYGGDYDKANAAYTDGPGLVDKLVDTFGSEWLKHAPEQARKRVAAFHNTFGEGAESLNRGAGSFSGGSQQPTQINVTIQATVNGKEASATASATGGQTASKVINMGNAAMQRR